jgi:hypothetical protein
MVSQIRNPTIPYLSTANFTFHWFQPRVAGRTAPIVEEFENTKPATFTGSKWADVDQPITCHFFPREITKLSMDKSK